MVETRPMCSYRGDYCNCNATWESGDFVCPYRDDLEFEPVTKHIPVHCDEGHDYQVLDGSTPLVCPVCEPEEAARINAEEQRIFTLAE